jgi:hypothetical protein
MTQVHEAVQSEKHMLKAHSENQINENHYLSNIGTRIWKYGLTA